MKQLPGKLLLTDWYTEWRMSFRWPSILLLQLKSKTSSKSIMGKIADWVTTNRLIVSTVTWYFYIFNARTAKKQSGKNSRVIDTKSWFLCNFKDSAGHSRKNIIPGVCSTVFTLGLNGFKVHCLKNSLR